MNSGDFAAIAVVLYAAHHVGDYWVQWHEDALLAHLLGSVRGGTADGDPVTGYKDSVGPVAQRLINRAEDSTASMVATKNYQEMRAARKLVTRGVFVQFGTLPFFFLKARLP